MSGNVSMFRMLGALVQGVILGGLLVLAVARLIQFASDARVFRYEGF